MNKKIQISRITFIAILLNLLCCYIIKAQDSIPYQDSLREANVTLSRMQDGQGESLMLGNGDLYGIVWEKENELFMRITKNDIWDARIDTSKDGDVPRVDVVSGKISGSHGTPPSYKHLYPQPRCAAALRLGAAPKKMSAQLDIKRALVSVNSADRPITTLRILHDRNVLLIKSPHAVTLEAIKAETLPDATLGTSNGVSWLLMKMPGDIDYKGMDYAVAVASKGTLKAISLVTSFDIQSDDVLEKAIALAKNTLSQNEITLIATHEEAWQAFWPLPAANHSELADPWISYVDQLLPKFKYLAKDRYGIDGACFPISSFIHQPDPEICSSKNQRQIVMNPWGMTIGMAGMTIQSM